MNNYFVYILTTKHDTTLYVGVTNNLERRIAEHKDGKADSFTKRYNIHKLVYFEQGNDVNAAIAREKQIKAWRREKKNILIANTNPGWHDLAGDWSISHGDPSLRSG